MTVLFHQSISHQSGLVAQQLTQTLLIWGTFMPAWYFCGIFYDDDNTTVPTRLYIYIYIYMAGVIWCSAFPEHHMYDSSDCVRPEYHLEYHVPEIQTSFVSCFFSLWLKKTKKQTENPPKLLHCFSGLFLSSLLLISSVLLFPLAVIFFRYSVTQQLVKERRQRPPY